MTWRWLAWLLPGWGKPEMSMTEWKRQAWR